MLRFILTSIFLLSLVLAGCTPGSNSVAEKRQAVLNMKNDVLAELYKARPDVKAQIAKASGYGVFSNANINVILASFGGGQGVVKDNRSGKHTYMKMGEVGIGPGLGVKDFRIVFVFHTKAALDRFVEHGWALGVQGDAAAKAGDKGGAVGGEITVDDMTIYQMTEAGLALQATLKGTKFWKDGSLN